MYFRDFLSQAYQVGYLEALAIRCTRYMMLYQRPPPDLKARLYEAGPRDGHMECLRILLSSINLWPDKDEEKDLTKTLFDLSLQLASEGDEISMRTISQILETDTCGIWTERFKQQGGKQLSARPSPNYPTSLISLPQAHAMQTQQVMFANLKMPA